MKSLLVDIKSTVLSGPEFQNKFFLSLFLSFSKCMIHNNAMHIQCFSYK